MLRPLPSKGMVEAECRMSSTISPRTLQRCSPHAAHAERPSTHGANRARSLVGDEQCFVFSSLGSWAYYDTTLRCDATLNGSRITPRHEQ